MPFPRLIVPLILLVSVFQVPTVRAEVSADLQKKINLAIFKARETLLPTIARMTQSPTSDYPMGRLALPVAAALKAGISPRDPVIVRAFEKLEKMPFQKTYSVSVYLFALDAKARKNKLPLSKGRTGSPKKSNVNSEIRRAVNWLVEARAEGRGWWSYRPVSPGGGHHDFSNTQFAVLGLQIGLEHGVQIPRAVFEEIARCFLGSQTVTGAPMDVKVTLSSSFAETLQGKTKVKGLSGKVPPAGWAYHHSQKSPYASMTAAGASCLLVVRNALGKNTRLRFEIEKALASAYGWIIKNFDDCVEGDRHHFYTLYSLEKVGDIGNIETFGEHDWYREGANNLLASQHGNGTWGSYTNTSLALMFLTRATRLSTANPIIYTKTEDDKKSEMNGDFVYLSKIDGFVSGRDILQFIAETRRADLLSVGREVIKNYSRKHRGDLTPILLSLWTGERDRITKFAKDSLAIVTGISTTRREIFEEWFAEYQHVRALENRSALESEHLADLLATIADVNLRSRLLDTAHRHRFFDLAGVFIEDMHESKDSAYRRKIHGILTLWTGRNISSPNSDTDEAWSRIADEWSDWWRAEKESFIVKVEARRWIDRLERLTRTGIVPLGGSTEKEAQKVVQAIIALGSPALPSLRNAMSRDEFSYYLIECYEALTKETLSLADLAGR